MSKKQLLVFIAIVTLALGAYYAALWLARDSELAMIGFVWFFGALFVTTIIIGAHQHLNVKPRHATMR